MNTLRRTPRLAVTGVAVASAFLLAACGGQPAADPAASAGGAASGQVRIDGSSTVEPLTSAAAELFREVNPNINVTVATSGTGGGFEQFCSGNTDISNASRPISEEEMATCMSGGIEYTELLVANDALTVVVNPENTWATCLTVEQLATMWGPDSEGTITNWNQVDPAFPDVPLRLYGPGTDSGTFTYFTDEINGDEGASRADYEGSEDDNVLVQGVAGDRGATSYFGYTYYEENMDSLTPVQIDGGNGCVAPSADTVIDGSYVPLGRPLFIYVNNEAFARPEVAEFVRYYEENIQQIAEAAQFIGLNEEQLAAADAALTSLGG